MHDDKEITLQFLDEAEMQSQGTVDDREKKHLVMIKQWYPDTWALDLPIEIWLDKDATLNEFASEISQKLNIAPEEILCTKINSPWNFHRVELPYVEWV